MGKFNKKRIGEAIVQSFHEQFAQNQNHHQSLFLQVLTVLITVLIGFGYLYIRVDVDSDELSVTAETIYAFMAIAAILLSLSISLIANMALGFRRDQLVASNIRMKAGVMPKKKETDQEYFPRSFNPVKNIGFWGWMPGFHQIFFVALTIIKIFLFLGLVLNSQFGLAFSCNPNWLISICVGFVLVSIISDVLVARHFWRKWKKYAKKARKRMKKQNLLDVVHKST